MERKRNGFSDFSGEAEGGRRENNNTVHATDNSNNTEIYTEARLNYVT